MRYDAANDGALAQLGERLHGMQEVSGSIPLGSTKFPYHPKCLAIGRPLDPVGWEAADCGRFP